MSLGEHVDMGMRDALAVELPSLLGECSVAEATFAHQRAKGFSERIRALGSHRPSGALF
jgi:hypothetical protein